MKLIRKMIHEQQGSAVILVSFALVGLLGMTGLVIDGGTLYMTKSHLQKAANAAALSGAQELTNDDLAVSEVVNEVLQAHQEQESLAEMYIENDKKVSVHLKKDVPLSFVKIFGWDSALVEVKASADIQTMGSAMGAAPLGIDDSIILEYGVEYKLKVDEEDVDTGNFGVLALGGPGANTYEDNLKHGYQDVIAIGDILETQTGNIAGKTRSGIKERIDACPYPVGETHHRDCPRIILIPVYKPYNHDQKQLKEVQVTGFAYFYISEPMNNQDKAIVGQFIERAGTGIASPDTVNKGAYSIRLTE